MESNAKKITAEECRELINKQIKTLHGTYKDIRNMASYGYDFCTFELKTIDDPEKQQEELIKDGFNVTISETAFKVKW